MGKERPDYLSYLLRLWRVSDGQDADRQAHKSIWRASLESTLTGERVSFANLDDLFDFLRGQTDMPPAINVDE